MLLEILRDSISFLAVSSIHILAFSTIFYRGYLANLVSQQSFGQYLPEAYTLYLGDWDTDRCSAIALPFFVLVTLLLTLIMLNMLIAIMGDTFDRRRDNIEVVNGREELAITMNVIIVKYNIEQAISFLHKLSVYCSHRCKFHGQTVSRNASSNSSNNRRKESEYGAGFVGKPYLLVVESYKGEGGEWSGRIKELKKMLNINQGNLQHELKHLRDQQVQLKEQLKEQLNVQEEQFKEQLKEQQEQLREQLKEQQSSSRNSLRKSRKCTSQAKVSYDILSLSKQPLITKPVTLRHL